MNAVIEMHDSECIAIEIDENGGGFVLLDAYIHRSEGEPLISLHEGGVQRIRLKLDGMTKEGAVGDLPAVIYEGSLIVGTERQDNIVSFPASYKEPVRLSMMLSDDARVLVVSGNGLSIEPEGDFRFVDIGVVLSRKGYVSSHFTDRPLRANQETWRRENPSLKRRDLGRPQLDYA